MARFPNSQKSLDELQLATKLIGFLAVLTALVYLRVVGAEMLSLLRAEGADFLGVLLFALLVVATVGLLLAWRQEGVGGLVTAVTAVAVGIVAFLYAEDNQLFTAFAYSSPFLITGLMFVVCWWRKH